MKKLLLCFLVSASLTACNNKQTLNNTDLLHQNLKGKVQTVSEITINLDSDGNAKSDSTIKMIDFNSDGYITTITSKDSSGKITEIQTNALNTNGTVSEVKKSKDGKQVSRLTTEVDKNGNYIGGKSYDSANNQDGYMTDFKTNEYGIIYSGKDHLMNGKIKNSWDATYEGPNFIGYTATDSLGRKSNGSVKLNEKGDAINENYSYYEKDSAVTKNYTHTYDSYDNKGNWTQRLTFEDQVKKTIIVKRIFTYYKD
jgi:hypothetical protein